MWRLQLLHINPVTLLDNFLQLKFRFRIKIKIRDSALIVKPIDGLLIDLTVIVKIQKVEVALELLFVFIVVFLFILRLFENCLRYFLKGRPLLISIPSHLIIDLGSGRFLLGFCSWRPVLLLHLLLLRFRR